MESRAGREKEKGSEIRDEEKRDKVVSHQDGTSLARAYSQRLRTLSRLG